MHRPSDCTSASSVTKKPAASRVPHPVGGLAKDSEKYHAGQDDGGTASHLAIHHEVSDPAARSQKLRRNYKHPRQTQSAAKPDNELGQNGRKNESPNHLKTAQPVQFPNFKQLGIDVTHGDGEIQINRKERTHRDECNF